MNGFKVKNWRQFQHYKDRNPPWIKLHFAMLSSEDWVSLDDASRVLAVACMLIASRNDGFVPNKPAYLKRVAYLNRTPNFTPLIECGFLEPASECKQMLADARPETETETETEESGKRFEKFWISYPRKAAKHDAAKAFKKLRLVNGDFEKVLAALEAAKQSEQWQRDDGKFIPHASTWLNGRRFEDVSPDRGIRVDV